MKTIDTAGLCAFVRIQADAILEQPLPDNFASIAEDLSDDELYAIYLVAAVATQIGIRIMEQAVDFVVDAADDGLTADLDTA